MKNLKKCIEGIILSDEYAADLFKYINKPVIGVFIRKHNCGSIDYYGFDKNGKATSVVLAILEGVMPVALGCYSRCEEIDMCQVIFKPNCGLPDDQMTSVRNKHLGVWTKQV